MSLIFLNSSSYTESRTNENSQHPLSNNPQSTIRSRIRPIPPPSRIHHHPHRARFILQLNLPVPTLHNHIHMADPPHPHPTLLANLVPKPQHQIPQQPWRQAPPPRRHRPSRQGTHDRPDAGQVSIRSLPRSGTFRARRPASEGSGCGGGVLEEER